MNILALLPAIAALAASLALPAAAQPYGERLEGFAYPHPVEIHSFSSQGQTVEMAYMDVAPTAGANGQTAVLLHGKNFCGATWDQTITSLSAAGYRVIVPDQIGFCKSSKPDGYQFSFQQLATNTNNLLNSLAIERAAIIGHSIGGMLAMRYALMFPEETSQLVLVNPIGLEDWQAKGVPYATIDQLYQGELKTSFNSIKAYQQRMYYDGDWKAEYERPVEMLAGLYEGPGKEKVAWNQAQTSEMLFTQPVIHEADQIAAPTLLLIGMKDRTAPGSNRASPELAESLGNYAVLSRKLAARIPDATLAAFEDLGHSPQIEAPDRFHKALMEGLSAEVAGEAAMTTPRETGRN